MPIRQGPCEITIALGNLDDLPDFHFSVVTWQRLHLADQYKRDWYVWLTPDDPRLAAWRPAPH
jgi:hypothetical protein